MKNKITAMLAAAAVIIVPASAATYTLSGGTGVDAFGIQDSLGRAFRAGTVAGAAFAGAAGGTSAGPGIVSVGIFSTDVFTGFTSAQFVSAFTNFGNIEGVFNIGGSGGNRGVFSLSTVAQVAGSAFAGKSMYLFSGNGSSFATSTDFLVYKSNTLFAALDDNNPAPIDVFITPLTGSVLFGTTVTDMKTTSSDTTVTPGFKMAAVPEPSAALMGMISVLGFLRRRRN